jgi:phosphonate transport system permease protein
MLVLSWVSVFRTEHSGSTSIISAETWHFATDFLRSLAGLNDRPGMTPAFLQWSRWQDMAYLAYKTLMMSILATGLAAAGMLLIAIPAARGVAAGAMSSSQSPLRKLFMLALRALYIVSRALPELIWAMIVIFIFTPGILPGAIALAIHNFGILGKIGTETVESLDPRPVRALASSGASRSQILLYAVLPQALPQFLTYVLYRWEIIIRTTIVIGAVSATGLGREFRLSMSFFHYTDVTLILIWYFLLVLMVDALCAYFRRLAR